MFSSATIRSVDLIVYVVGHERAGRTFLTELIEIVRRPDALFETPFGCLTSISIPIADEHVRFECFAVDDDSREPGELLAIARCDALLILPGSEAIKAATAALAHVEHPPVVVWPGTPTQPLGAAFAELRQVERVGTPYDVFKGACVGLMAARKAGQLRERNPEFDR